MSAVLPGRSLCFLWGMSATEKLKAANLGAPTSSLEDLSGSLRAIRQRQRDNLVVPRVFDLERQLETEDLLEWGGKANIVEDNERAVDTANGVIVDPRRHPVRRRIPWVDHRKWRIRADCAGSSERRCRGRAGCRSG